MSKGLFVGQKAVLQIIVDFELNPFAAAGNWTPDSLPPGFVAQSMSVQTITPTTASTTLKVGNAADDDGYMADVIASDGAAKNIQRCNGALLYEGTDKYFKEYPVALANIGFKLTAGAAISDGKYAFFIEGYQAFE